MGYTRYFESNPATTLMNRSEVQSGVRALREFALRNPDKLTIEREFPTSMGIVLGTRCGAGITNSIVFTPQWRWWRFATPLSWTKTYGYEFIDPIVKQAFEILRDAVNGKILLSCDGEWDGETS